MNKYYRIKYLEGDGQFYTTSIMTTKVFYVILRYVKGAVTRCWTEEKNPASYYQSEKKFQKKSGHLSRKGNVMRTVIYAYNLYSEQKLEALDFRKEQEQGLTFTCSYQIRQNNCRKERT